MAKRAQGASVVGGLLLLVVLGSIFTTTGRELLCAASAWRCGDLSEPPVERGDASPLPPGPASQLELVARLDTRTLTTVARKNVPTVIPLNIGDVRSRRCAFWNPFADRCERYLSVSVHTDGEITTTEPITISPVDSGFLVRMALNARVRAYRGSSQVTGRAGVRVAVIGRISVDSTWTPQVRLVQSHVWTRRPVFYLLGIPVTVAGKASQELQKAVAKAQVGATKAANAIGLRESAEALWALAPAERRFSVGEGSGLWGLVDLESAYLLPLIRESDSTIALRLGLGARVRLSTDSSLQQLGPSRPLPPLGATPPEIADTRIAIPISIGYAVLSDSLTGRIASRDPIELGPLQIRLAAVRVYPSAPRIVLAAEVRGDSAGTWGSRFRGTIYLTAIPQFDATRQSLVLDSLAFTAFTNSRLVDVLTVAARAFLLEELRKRAVVPLGPALDDARASIAKLADNVTAQFRGAAAAKGEPVMRDIAANGALEASLDSIVDIAIRPRSAGLMLQSVVAGRFAITVRPSLSAGSDMVRGASRIVP